MLMILIFILFVSRLLVGWLDVSVKTRAMSASLASEFGQLEDTDTHLRIQDRYVSGMMANISE